jgi:hypothetical protein
MGMDKYVHLGPYLLVPKLQEAVTTKIQVNKDGKEVTSGHKFDPVTGEQYETKYKTEDKINRPSSYGDKSNWDEFEALGLDEDAFYQGEGCETKTHAIFLANDGSRSTDEEEPTSLMDLDIQKELEKFKVKHKKYIDFYTKAYGPVIVDYGLVPYWS